MDAVAAEGKIPIDVQKDGIDLLTLSSNDIYGPQGAGALYVKPGFKDLAAALWRRLRKRPQAREREPLCHSRNE